jgi:predicted enzyme related to lactoylglutathione lyase
MSAKKLSRRRALKIASLAAVPSVLLGHESLWASATTARPDDAAGSERATGNQQEKAKQEKQSSQPNEGEMNVGAFSVSLTVKDLKASLEFYEHFGFKPFAGNPSQNWQILKNGDHVIGLFQGMFEKNMLTFNPGWDQNAQKLEKFTDVRELQRRLKAKGVKFVTEADESTTGPASFLALDPDGNPILFDQHV